MRKLGLFKPSTCPKCEVFTIIPTEVDPQDINPVGEFLVSVRPCRGVPAESSKVTMIPVGQVVEDDYSLMSLAEVLTRLPEKLHNDFFDQLIVVGGRTPEEVYLKMILPGSDISAQVVQRFCKEYLSLTPDRWRIFDPAERAETKREEGKPLFVAGTEIMSRPSSAFRNQPPKQELLLFA